MLSSLLLLVTPDQTVSAPVTFDAALFETAATLDRSACKVIQSDSSPSVSASLEPKLCASLEDSVCLITSLSLNMMDFTMLVSVQRRSLKPSSSGPPASSSETMHVVGQVLVQSLLDYASAFNEERVSRGLPESAQIRVVLNPLNEISAHVITA